MPAYDGKFKEEGNRIFCAICGMPANVIYDEFPCKGDFVVTRLTCRLGCGARWRREIPPPTTEEIENGSTASKD